MTLIRLLVSALLAAGCSTCTHISLDSSAEAATANDYTVVFNAGGAKSQKGFLFFQKRVGTLPTDQVNIIVPKLDCKRDSCISYTFFRKDGSPGASGGIPHDQTKVSLTLSDIVGHADLISQKDDGEYSCMLQLFALGPTGDEFMTVLNGFVRLNVLADGYSPVGCDDTAIAFRVPIAKNCEAQFTTAGRSVVCGKGCR